MPQWRTRVAWWTPPVITALCLVLGVVVGAATNVINGHVSSRYFEAVMRWPSKEVPLRAIRQGMLEGAGVGLLYAVIFVISIVASTRLRCPLSLAVGAALRTMPIALACWTLGGVAGVALAVVEPDLFRWIAIGVPSDPAELRRYAWVGGSIWGAYAAAGIGGLYAAISVHRRWGRFVTEHSPAFAVLPAPISASLAREIPR